MRIFFTSLISVLFRLLPHLPNFTPIGAGSAWIARTMSLPSAILYTLLIYTLGNLCLSYFHGMLFYFPGALYVYAGIALYAVAGFLFKGKRFGLLAASFTGSCMFFLISNFGVWISGWYGKDFTGFVQCYVNALPFFQNTLMGDLTWALCFTAIDEMLPLLQKYLAIQAQRDVA